MPVYNKRLTSIARMGEIVCHWRAFQIAMTHEGREMMEGWGRGGDEVMAARLLVGRLDDGAAGRFRVRAYIVTLCYNQPMKRVNNIDTQLRGR